MFHSIVRPHLVVLHLPYRLRSRQHLRPKLKSAMQKLFIRWHRSIHPERQRFVLSFYPIQMSWRFALLTMKHSLNYRNSTQNRTKSSINTSKRIHSKRNKHRRMFIYICFYIDLSTNSGNCWLKILFGKTEYYSDIFMLKEISISKVNQAYCSTNINKKITQ